MISIVERIRERVQKGARTFMIKVKAHRGEPLNERADTQAENARQLQDDYRQWRESVLFIGTQFSILYTFMYSPA